MPITDISQLSPEMREAATPVTPGAPAAVPAGVPVGVPPTADQTAPAQPDQALPLTTPGQAPSLTPMPVPSHAEKIGTIAGQLNDSGPGSWARKLVISAQSALQSMQTGLGDMEVANQEIQKSHPYGAGILDYIGAQQNAKNARVQAEQKATDEHDRERGMIAYTNVQSMIQEQTLHALKGKVAEDANNQAIQNGLASYNMAVTEPASYGLTPAKVIMGGGGSSADITESQLQKAITDKTWDPTQEQWAATSKVPSMDGNKQRVDVDGNPMWEKRYTIFTTPPKIRLSQDNADFLNSNIPGSKWTEGQEMPGATGLLLFQQANNAHAAQAKRASDLEEADIQLSSLEHTKAQLDANKALDNDPDYQKARAHIRGLENLALYVTGQAPTGRQVPEIGPDGKPTGRTVPEMDPQSVAYAQSHPNGLVDIRNSYGFDKKTGESIFDKIVESERKDAQPDVAVKDLPKNEQEAAAQTSAAETAFKTNPTPGNKAALDRAKGIQDSVRTVVQNERQFSSDLQKANNEASKGLSQTNELAKKGFDDINKQWTDLSHGFSGALAQINNTRNAIQAGADGSGLMTSMVPTMEVLGINHAAGISRISPQEAIAAGMPGGFAERWNAWGTKAATGRLTPELAKEGRQLMDIIVRSKYSQSLQSTRMLAANSGIDPNQVTVLDIDGQPATLASRIKIATPPPGATGTAPDPKTGKLWWHDAKGKALGQAE